MTVTVSCSRPKPAFCTSAPTRVVGRSVWFTGMGRMDTLAAVLTQVVVDREALVRHVRQALQSRSQVSLEELVAERPLRQGLAELIAYLQRLGTDIKIEQSSEVASENP